MTPTVKFNGYTNISQAVFTGVDISSEHGPLALYQCKVEGGSIHLSYRSIINESELTGVRITWDDDPIEFNIRNSILVNCNIPDSRMGALASSWRMGALASNVLYDGPVYDNIVTAEVPTEQT